MKWIETVIVYFFPTILLEGKPWRLMWEDKERQTYILICRFFFFGSGCLYIGHYFFYDIPMGLEPIERWFAFRISMTILAFAAFGFYLTRLTRSRFYKVPAILVCWAYCYSQAMITTWWDGTPWLFSFVFVAITIPVIRLSPLNTVILATLVMLTQAPFLTSTGVPLSSVVSAGTVTIALLIILRISHITAIKNFVLNQENIAAQKQIIELNIEFADRIRAFIPKIIAKRLESYISENRLTVLQAAVEVLKPRRTNVACLFSDIRGYTQSSKDLETFITQSVLPEMKACSDKVEEYSGIPRKVGDLIFAYFDDDSKKRNTIRALVAGMEISRLNHDMNATATQSEIRRYILISSGDAIVGNLGGLNSSIEITALGSPVNFLSRVDDLTKNQIMAKLLNPGDMVICSETHSIVSSLGAELDCDEINLHSLGLTIRDFPETSVLFRIQPNELNYKKLKNLYHCIHGDTIAAETTDDLRLSRSI